MGRAPGLLSVCFAPSTFAANSSSMITFQDCIDDRPTFIALFLIAAVLFWRFSILVARPDKEWSSERGHVRDVVKEKTANMATKTNSVMSAPAKELAPPKDDPISPSKLAEFNGQDPSKPILLAIKGTVFDVTAKKEMYGPGGSYNVFAGKDGSKGLGMSSLKPEDAIPDFSSLDKTQCDTLNQWYAFFQKRYNVVGKVTPQ